MGCGLIAQVLFLIIWNAYQVAATSKRKFFSLKLLQRVLGS